MARALLVKKLFLQGVKDYPLKDGSNNIIIAGQRSPKPIKKKKQSRSFFNKYLG